MHRAIRGVFVGVLALNALQLMAFYSPKMGRWQTPDPIEEKGGLNLYAYCRNDAVSKYDKLGLDVTLTTGNRNARWFELLNHYFHQEVCVDTWIWNETSCCWRRTGRACFSFAATGFGFGSQGDDWLGMSGSKGPSILRGEVYETDDQGVEDTETRETTPCQDIAFLGYLSSLVNRGDAYSLLMHSCRTFSQAMMDEAKRRNHNNDRRCKYDDKCN